MHDAAGHLAERREPVPQAQQRGRRFAFLPRGNRDDAQAATRFRQGDSNASLVVRTIANLFWYPLAAITRFYLVVLVEPGINPIKAPISIIAAKIIYPLAFIPIVKYIENLEPGFGKILDVVAKENPGLWHSYAMESQTVVAANGEEE
jgi:hypothetical protein